VQARVVGTGRLNHPVRDAASSDRGIRNRPLGGVGGDGAYAHFELLEEVCNGKQPSTSSIAPRSISLVSGVKEAGLYLSRLSGLRKRLCTPSMAGIRVHPRLGPVG
jgi:hypothetical protein